MLQMADPFYIGDVVEMRKPHPCGGVTWEVVRVGADIGLCCQTCGRRDHAHPARFRARREEVRAPRARGQTWSESPAPE